MNEKKLNKIIDKALKHRTPHKKIEKFLSKGIEKAPIINSKILGNEVIEIVFFDDRKTFRIYFKDGCVTDGEIL